MADLTPISFKKPVQSAPRLTERYVPGKRHERYWTEDEKAIVREVYPTGGAAACHLRMPRHAVQQIYAMAKALGIAYVGASAPRKKRTPVADLPSDQAIREGWALLKGRAAVKRFADELGVPRYWLTDRATKLGLTIPHRKEPPWTAPETALMQKVPLHNPDRCCAIFREHGFSRSPASIMIRAKKLSLSRRKRDTFSATMAAELLGVDGKTVSEWIIAGHIAATKRDDNRLPQQGGSRWEIAPYELRRFILDSLERIDVRKVEKFAFVQLIATPFAPQGGEKVACEACRMRGGADLPYASAS